MPVTLLMLQGVSCCVSHNRDLRLHGEGLHGGERTWGRETPVEQGGLACPSCPRCGGDARGRCAAREERAPAASRCSSGQKLLRGQASPVRRNPLNTGAGEGNEMCSYLPHLLPLPFRRCFTCKYEVLCRLNSSCGGVSPSPSSSRHR